MATKNAFAGYKEKPESKGKESKESKGLQRYEQRRGMDKAPMRRAGRKC